MLLAVLAVGIPFLLLATTAWRSVPTFDGAMNLQVAANIADGDGFVRDYHYDGIVRPDIYGNTTIAPEELQTSGFWVLIAAAGIKVFGLSVFSLQLTNLLFMFGLLALVWTALRPWPVLRLVGPTAVIFVTPTVADISLGGNGEFSIAALALGAFVALAKIAEGNRHAVKLSLTAFALLGIAITIKTISVALVPVVLLGVVLAALARSDVPRLRFLATVPMAGGPVLAFEIYRMTQLGSVARWIDYWKNQAGMISYQSGVNQAESAVPMLAKGRDHWEILSNIVGIPDMALALLLALPGALLLASFLLRGCSLREWLAKPGRLLVTLLVSYEGLYLLWWLFITPTEKAWIRRLIIGWVVMVVASLVLAGIAWTSARTRWSEPTFRHARIPAVLAACVFVPVYVGSAAPLVAKNFDSYTSSRPEPENVRAAATYVKSISADGGMPCGLDWWSAPVISLYADLPFCNLVKINSCTAPYRQLIEAGGLYLVWDFYAKAIIGARPPEQMNYRYALVADPSPYAAIYKVSQTTRACPE